MGGSSIGDMIGETFNFNSNAEQMLDGSLGNNCRQVHALRAEAWVGERVWYDTQLWLGGARCSRSDLPSAVTQRRLPS